MSRIFPRHSRRESPRLSRRSSPPPRAPRQRGSRHGMPRQSLTPELKGEPFCLSEVWHEPVGREQIEILTQPPGAGYLHPVNAKEVADRIEQLPARFRQPLEVVQLSTMTRKRALVPLYGLQWGATVYLYPIESSLIESYTCPPLPAQVIEARMFGGRWTQDGKIWHLEWSLPALKDFYLNNILIHEIGHVNDTRNTNPRDRERFAEWFAIEYGYRASRRRP